MVFVFFLVQTVFAVFPVVLLFSFRAVLKSGKNWRLDQLWSLGSVGRLIDWILFGSVDHLETGQIKKILGGFEPESVFPLVHCVKLFDNFTELRSSLGVPCQTNSAQKKKTLRKAPSKFGGPVRATAGTLQGIGVGRGGR